MKWDGHTHTKFCYHGSNADQELYINRAIELGFERYTISEHPPLPEGYVVDERLMKELAMPENELPLYIEYAKQMKEKYKGQIDITVGLELDFLPGQLSFTERIVEQWQKDLEDVVYSVHYLPGVGGTRCIDFTPDDFKTNLLSYYGSMEKVVDEYYNHVESAIAVASKLPMRKRIGHINLIEKFSLQLPPIEEEQIKRRLEAILPMLEQGNVGIDVNTAGLRVPTCGKPYVPEWFLQECLRRGIECVYGSDSHKPEHVGLGWDWFAAQTGQ
ncbi:histidinol-phosphatase [Paenibacillus baekrokdamisoli]|uniref:Histidinol-phosphatase n=1 Tax=Paenibacillus baekrokdamisoli TaxID=1712516 RepID=A0A3G9JE03_9BACL|nr:histidinol-phosphatase HisJ [Paenibacillus baekrokdamisoli]MBB3070834.1 histidinol-phosphatase (PHP family) [Paenibacillus baekrokdamisoli]BBH22228.1 histidinol-phosphatase [Paenibacillus baekrokdamisoli]